MYLRNVITLIMVLFSLSEFSVAAGANISLEDRKIEKVASYYINDCKDKFDLTPYFEVLYSIYFASKPDLSVIPKYPVAAKKILNYSKIHKLIQSSDWVAIGKNKELDAAYCALFMQGFISGMASLADTARLQKRKAVVPVILNDNLEGEQFETLPYSPVLAK